MTVSRSCFRRVRWKGSRKPQSSAVVLAAKRVEFVAQEILVLARDGEASRMAIGVEAKKAEGGLPADYSQACRLAEHGQYNEARRLYRELEGESEEIGSPLRALIKNDLAVLAALEGQFDEARQGWQQALEVDPSFRLAFLNDVLIAAEVERLTLRQGDVPAALELALSPSTPPASDAAAALPARQPVRVAVVSFLFNWPSTGGGNIHTVELAKFLARAGFEVKHIHASYAEWQIGQVDNDLPIDSEALEFDVASWNVPAIQARFREAVDAFAPDYVIVTDAWNMKPILAEAVRGYPYLLRFQAQECLCPLNNLRLLLGGPGEFAQCPRNQLATPETCRRCLAERGQRSGPLHQAERALAGVGTREYDQKLRRAIYEAEAVLALNPLTAALLEPYARCVRVVPWGMDPGRFPWPTETPSSGPSGHLPPQETVRLSNSHFLRVFTRGLSPPQFVEGDEVVDQDGEANLSLGPLTGFAREPFESAEALRVRKPSLHRAATLTVEGFALWCLHPVPHLVDPAGLMATSNITVLWCLHPVPHLVDQVFVRLATHRPSTGLTLHTTSLQRALLAVGRVGLVNLQHHRVPVGLLFRRTLPIRQRMPLGTTVARNRGVPSEFVLPDWRLFTGLGRFSAVKLFSFQGAITSTFLSSHCARSSLLG